MSRFLTRGQLHGLLKERGHAFWSAEPVEAPIDVFPPPETHLTIGLDPDATLKPAYRNHYFACLRDADDEPLLFHAPAFAQRERASRCIHSLSGMTARTSSITSRLC